MSTGQFLKKLRLEKGLTQEEEADKIHVDRTLINKIENDKATLTKYNMKLFCDFFDISEVEIIAGERINSSRSLHDKLYSFYITKTNCKLILKSVFAFLTIVIIAFLTYFFHNIF